MLLADARILMLTTNRRLDRRIVFEANVLAEAGAAVTILARETGDERDTDHRLSPGVAIVRFATPFPMDFPLKPVLVAAYRKFLADERLPERAFAPWTGKLVAAAIEHPADVVHVHDIDSLPAGVELKRRFEPRLVYDAHEFAAESARTRLDNPKLADFLLDVEPGLARQADARITASGPLAALLDSSLRPKTPFAPVENVPPEPTAADRAEGRAIFEALFPALPEHDLRVVDSGSIEKLRNPFVLVEAARLAGPRVLICVTEMGPQAAELKAQAEAAGVANLVFVPPVAPRLLAGFLSGFDAGLVTIRGISRYYARMSPNRFYDYLATGLPVLFDPSLVILRDYDAALRFGFSCDMAQPARLAKLLGTLAGKKGSLKARAEAAAKLHGMMAERARATLLGVYEKLS